MPLLVMWTIPALVFFVGLLNLIQKWVDVKRKNCYNVSKDLIEIKNEEDDFPGPKNNLKTFRKFRDLLQEIGNFDERLMFTFGNCHRLANLFLHSAIKLSNNIIENSSLLRYTRNSAYNKYLCLYGSLISLGYFHQLITCYEKQCLFKLTKIKKIWSCCDDHFYLALSSKYFPFKRKVALHHKNSRETITVQNNTGR